jgi:hypothetical protein
MPIGMSDAETIKSLFHLCAQLDVDRAVLLRRAAMEPAGTCSMPSKSGNHAAGRLDL